MAFIHNLHSSNPPPYKGGAGFFHKGYERGGLRFFDEKGGELLEGQGPVKRGGVEGFLDLLVWPLFERNQGTLFFKKMSKIPDSDIRNVKEAHSLFLPHFLAENLLKTCRN